MFGNPDEQWGERDRAAIARVPDTISGEQEDFAHCREPVARPQPAAVDRVRGPAAEQISRREAHIKRELRKPYRHRRSRDESLLARSCAPIRHPKPLVGGRPLAISARALAALTLTAALVIGLSPTYAAATRLAEQRASLPPSCRAADLALSFLGGKAATGHGLLRFALKNTSSATCATIGYPRVQFLDRAGKPLPTIAAHTTEDFFGSAPLRRLSVAPGASVSFRLGVAHRSTSTANCATAYGLQPITPTDAAPLRTLIPDGVYECQRITLTPLQPARLLFPDQVSPVRAQRENTRSSASDAEHESQPSAHRPQQPRIRRRRP